MERKQIHVIHPFNDSFDKLFNDMLCAKSFVPQGSQSNEK